MLDFFLVENQGWVRILGSEKKHADSAFIEYYIIWRGFWSNRWIRFTVSCMVILHFAFYDDGCPLPSIKID